LFEIVEPLRDAIQELRQLAEKPMSAEGSAEQYAQWSLWLEQLRVVFRVADASWPRLQTALASSKAGTDPPRRGRFSSGGKGQ